ncbi:MULTISPECIES: hypothetical protein [unclassified Pseudonocardia]|uniref:hypothetical protein n=1 Tax=unclassified Pseudonocardia TaxID=2619320 RepID=UPI000959D2AC|nr:MULTISPECIES: hypothetical protein [unclassified Pseudonocardia]MBN9102887.1 hypothetical protein [Pseudonocardia sp.]OJY48174.1 MAG: hypothetical protein BGP03_11040 [Pseudonocardia sp. 73-21]
MSKIELVLRELHRSENSLARDLLTVADRHRVEHEIFHTARDVARWSHDHVRLIAGSAAAHDLHLDPAPSTGSPALLERLTHRTSELLGRRPEPGLLLLADLRRLHRKAAGVSLDWELLSQAAQAMRQRDLFELARRCHPQTLRQMLRQMRWANGQLKIVSPQIIAS